MSGSSSEKGLKGFLIRKEAKGYGLQKRIEGNMIPPVVIVDDVTTSGKSVMDSIEAVNAEGVTPKQWYCWYQFSICAYHKKKIIAKYY